MFGGGRIGSVGVNDGKYDDDPLLNTFEMQDGDGHGFITINIGGDDADGQTGHINIGHAAGAHDRVGGNVYGGGKGAPGPAESAYPRLAQVKDATVNIKERAGDDYHTWIEGSVFGSGEDGHVTKDTHVKVFGGQIGGKEYSSTPVQCADEFHGNVYGAGRGLDTYEDSSGNQHYSPTAGIVKGNTYIDITGGHVVRNVYGGGNLASVGELDKDDTGIATVRISGSAVIGTGIGDWGHVFGAGKGKAGSTFADYSKVYETRVIIDGAKVYGSVFGGGEDGHVVKHKNAKGTSTFNERGDTHVAIMGTAEIGTDGDTDAFKKYHGNVYGGGRSIDKDEDGDYSRTAGKVSGNTHVNILDGDVYQYVYGGGDQSIVDGRKIVNIYGGWVHEDVYGGSNEIPFNVRWSNPGLKTVNMFGGKVLNLFGCSRNTIDGDFELHDSANHLVYVCESGDNQGKLVYKIADVEYVYTGNDEDLTITPKDSDPTSFVNVSGGYLYALGEEMGSVHAAGMAGVVYGSTIINIGKDAIYNAPYSKPADDKNIDKNDLYSENTLLGLGLSLSDPPHVPHKLQVSGSVFGGSNYFKAESTDVDFTNFNVQGYSNIYIDGKDYDMDELADGYDYENWIAASDPKDYMVIDGNIFGSGTHCESGHLGRNITVRNYGNRNTSSTPGQEGWFTGSTRPLGTIQRCNHLVIDHSNFTFTGMRDLADDASTQLYAVYNVDDCFYVANGSGLTLGKDGPADMDSIRMMRSGALKGSYTFYDDANPANLMDDEHWHWVGIRERSAEANKLYYKDGDEETFSGELEKTEENVLVFTDVAKLYIRYTTPAGKTKYGQLEGFFRMIAEEYIPWAVESFAHARPKLTTANTSGYSGSGENKGDGGFMSYNKKYNFYINGSSDYDDGGLPHTRRNQYPYTNVVSLSKDGDSEEYRVWLIPDFKGARWYVDGTRGWGVDDNSNGRGLYPDKPKQSLTGTYGVFNGTKDYNGNDQAFSWYNDTDNDIYKDIIYVVGSIDAIHETLTIAPDGAYPDESIILYRYPGGHKLSNSPD